MHAPASQANHPLCSSQPPLADIVRSSIVFDSLEKLLGCLKAIAASDAVDVLRVKNRFRKGYDPTESAGFR